MSASPRRHLPFLLLLALAAFLRLYGLGWLPSPAGDEGNWTLYGLRFLRGETASLAPDASFVSLLFARLIAASMAAFGPTFEAARLVGVTAILLAVVAAYAIPAVLGSRRAGLALAGVIALHPWAVLYARTASVPYALALATGTIGPLLFVAGARRGRIAMVAAGIQVVALGAHFSPLTAVAAVACGLFALHAPHRWLLRHPLTYLSVVAGALHVTPVVLGAARVARKAAPLVQVRDFGSDLGSYLHMMTTGLAGEATLRHFTNSALPPWTAAWLALPVAGVVILAASPRARAASVLHGFGPLYLGVGLLVAPLILAPGRNWYMPANHMDRYLFAVLPGFAMCVADVASLMRPRGSVLAGALLAWLLVGGTGRAAQAFLTGGGVDHGEGIFDGGSGYRGWLVAREPRATVLQIRDAVLAEVGAQGAAILVADRVFLPLRFAAAGTGLAVHDVRRVPVPARHDGRYYVVLWPDHVLSIGSPPTAPPKYVASNQRLRERMHRLFGRVTLVRRLVQRDGTPLLELWRAEDPLPRLREKEPDPEEEISDEIG